MGEEKTWRGGQVLMLGWTEKSGPAGATQWWYIPVELGSLGPDQRELLGQVQLLKRKPAELEALFGRDKCRGPDLRAAVSCLLPED